MAGELLPRSAAGEPPCGCWPSARPNWLCPVAGRATSWLREISCARTFSEVDALILLVENERTMTQPVGTT